MTAPATPRTLCTVASASQRQTFGETVKRLREARGWPMRVLAEKVGVSTSSVGSWEQGGGATEPNVRALERVFGEPLGWILGYDPPPATSSPEDAIAADPRIPEHDKTILLAHLAAVRRLAAKG